MSEPEPRRLTRVERRWVAVVLALVAELASMLLPRARADSFEAFFSTYYSSGVPYDAATIDVDAFFFGGPAAGEVALMVVVAMLATAMLLRRDLAPGLRTPGLIFAALLPAWVALAAAVVSGGALAALALAR